MAASSVPLRTCWHSLSGRPNLRSITEAWLARAAASVPSSFFVMNRI